MEFYQIKYLLQPIEISNIFLSMIQIEYVAFMITNAVYSYKCCKKNMMVKIINRLVGII
uniref:Uncharacterized protein n=1 Tax=Arundo donax TaxID=35708 RepID=A0A0A8Z760_ARUDO